jgi:hypothetical protein
MRKANGRYAAVLALATAGLDRLRRYWSYGLGWLTKRCPHSQNEREYQGDHGSAHKAEDDDDCVRLRLRRCSALYPVSEIFFLQAI